MASEDGAGEQPAATGSSPIDELCNRFTAAWRGGSRPKIEDFLSELMGSEHDTALRELLIREIALRRSRGEQPAPDEYRARLAARAGTIEAAFGAGSRADLAAGGAADLPISPGGDATASAPGTSREGSPGQGASIHPTSVPDGYEILGLIGRGGMGVVYKARQVRLNRVVALKMVSAGDQATPEALVRFLVEAEAIARLRHVNVAQIYDRGECAGLPYLAMEYFAAGRLTLRDGGAPWPAREASRLVEQVARGVAEVHRLGIVHRDLKPANILMGDDGTPKVSDFGLAKSTGSQSGMTPSDFILGTPSYMAPEQAEGKAKAVGPPADIYALGSIFYELLTGRPPFRGATALETLDQVRSAEPVAPSRLVPGVPRDAETIALKCLQKEPSRRYASADELAEDLRRFVAGETIVARPVGPLVRGWRWCRRHPAPAVLGGLLAAAVAAGLTGILLEWRRAERNLAEARSNFTLARRAVDEMLVRISENKLIDQPGLQGLRRELLEAASGYFREFANRRQDDPAVRAERVLAHVRLGQIDLKIAPAAEAEAEFRRALAVAGHAKGDAALESARADAYGGLCDAQAALGRPEQALASVEMALGIITSQVARRPGDVELRKAMARCTRKRARLYGTMGQIVREEPGFREAASLWESLIRDHPEDTMARRELGQVELSLAFLLSRTSGRGQEGIVAYRHCLQGLRELAESPAGEIWDRANLAQARVFYGEFLGFNLGRWDEARAEFEPALAGLDKLVAENPLVVPFRSALAAIHYELGYLELRQANYRAAYQHYRSAIEIQERLRRDDPSANARFQVTLPNILIDVAEVCRLSGDLAGAVAALEGRCIPLFEEVTRSSPSIAEFRMQHAMAYRYLARVRLEAGEIPKAIEAARRADALLGPGMSAPEGTIIHQSESARIRLVLADSLRASGRGTEALAAYDRALEALEPLAKSNPDKPDMQDALAEALVRRAALKRREGHPREAAAEARRGRELLESLPRDDPTRLVRLAAARLVDGQPAEQALDALRRAVDAGLACPPILRNDPDLAPLHENAAFRRLVEQVEARSKELAK